MGILSSSERSEQKEGREDLDFPQPPSQGGCGGGGRGQLGLDMSHLICMEVLDSLTSKTFRAELKESRCIMLSTTWNVVQRSNAHRCKRERQDVLPPPQLHSYHTHDAFCLEQYEIFRALIPSFLPTFPFSSFLLFPFLHTCSFPVVPGTEPNVCGDPAVGGLYERLAAVQDSDRLAGFFPQHQAQSMLSKCAWN